MPHGLPLSKVKAHYIKDDGRSLCGRFEFDFIDGDERPDIPPGDACVTCRQIWKTLVDAKGHARMARNPQRSF